MSSSSKIDKDKSTSRTEKAENNLERTVRKVILLHDSLIPESGDGIKIFKLPHPGHGEESNFTYSKEQKVLYEICQYEEPYRSWFINESVCSDGKLYLSVPTDPLFLVLQVVKKNCSKFATPFNNWEESKNEMICEIFENTPEKSILMIADIHTAGDIVAYKLNKTKAMSWLLAKIRKLEKSLKENKDDFIVNGTSEIRLEDSNNENKENKEYLRLAFRLVVHLIDDELLEELSKYFPDDELKKRKNEHFFEDYIAPKKAKLEKQKEEKPKVSAKAKALTKAASGTRSISSFFTKK